MAVATHHQSEFFDLSFSTEPASYYYLLAEIDRTHFRACWYHQNKGLVTGFATYPLPPGELKFSIPKLINNYPFLASDFKQCIISLRTDNYVLTPRTNEKHNKTELFKVTNQFNEEAELLSEAMLINAPASITYALPIALDEVVRKTFFNSILVPHVAPRIESALNDIRLTHEINRIHIHVSAAHVDVIAIKNSKLHLCNSFFQSGKEDIAYYVLYCADVLDIDPSLCTLQVSGMIEPKDECWSLLNLYWKQLEIVPIATEIKVSQRLDGYPGALFNYLTQSLLCAS